MGLIPGSRRSPGEGNGNLLQYSCLGNLRDRRAWWAKVQGIAKGLDTIYQLNKSSNKSHLLYLCRHTVSLWFCSLAPDHLWSLFILIDSWEREERLEMSSDRLSIGDHELCWVFSMCLLLHSFSITPHLQTVWNDLYSCKAEDWASVSHHSKAWSWKWSLKPPGFVLRWTLSAFQP